MLRLHVHVSTDDIAKSVKIYSALFGEPLLVKDDYVKWEPKDMPVVFAVSHHGKSAGIDHMGVRADTAEELAALTAKLLAAKDGMTDVIEQKGAACCYSVADKLWFTDVSSVPWEIYHGTGSIEIFGTDVRPTKQAACCAPTDTCCAPKETAPLPQSILILHRSME